MKFMHLGDLHIGKIVNGFNMLEDQRYMLEKLLEEMKCRSVDTVLIAGDVYDRAVPTEEAVELLNWFLTSLSQAGIAVCMVSGNHDSDERLNFLRAPLEQAGIYISPVFDGSLTRVTLHDQYGPVNIFLMPYIKAHQVANQLKRPELAQDYEGAVAAVIAGAEIDVTERNVMVSHQFVTAGKEEPQMGGSEVFFHQLGTVDRVSSAVYKNFDYTALGHIHASYPVDGPNIRYCGSLLKYSQREAKQVKTVPVVSLQEKGDIQVETISIKPLRDLREKTGTFEEIYHDKEDINKDDYICFALTDVDIMPDAMSLLQSVYPHAMHLEYKNSQYSGISSYNVGDDVPEQNFQELIGSFFNKVTAQELDDEQWDILNEVAKEAGVIE